MPRASLTDTFALSGRIKSTLCPLQWYDPVGNLAAAPLFVLRSASRPQSDSISYVKSQISEALNDTVSPNKMRIYVDPPPSKQAPKKDDDEEMKAPAAAAPILLPDEALLSDHGIKNDCVLYATFVKSEEDRGDGVVDESTEWEEVQLQEAP